MGCSSNTLNAIGTRAGRLTERLARYIFSALVASSLSVLHYNPDLLFCCLVIPSYLLLFVLHALWIRSYAVNTIVVFVFWALPFCLDIVHRYCKYGNWEQALVHLTVPYIRLQFIVVGIHLLLQAGLVCFFRNRDDW
jgi:hypothetical protein